ncbi:MAG: TIGR04066 family peptide maturation system protein [Oscillospiraceae bacterium]|nr:TIGR04066 family peptide maturation system protein [Oscillospiraceae bacterium]
MKERLAIYPFSEEAMTLLRHQDKIEGYDITCAIIPKGWKSHFDEEQPIKCLCSEDNFYLENLINNIDAVLLCKFKQLNDMSFYERIISAVQSNSKQIIYTPELESLVGRIDADNRVCLKPPESPSITNNDELFNIDVPVIMVLGVGENCDKLDTQLSIYDYFNKKGYKPKLISSNIISQIMGMSAFPDCIDNHKYTFLQQVKIINTFVKNIELKEKPELIIIGVPGGIMKYSKAVPNGYGYVPFLISNAIAPDVAVLSLYCGDYQEEKIKEIKSMCYYRMGVMANYFHISNKTCNYDIETKQLNYYPVDKPYLIENLIRPQENIPAFNVLDDRSREKAFEAIMKELQANIAVV